MSLKCPQIHTRSILPGSDNPDVGISVCCLRLLFIVCILFIVFTYNSKGHTGFFVARNLKFHAGCNYQTNKPEDELFLLMFVVCV